ncbi:hypothetical protein AB0K51_27110 [Kitasatospora sp. NPDC049285]
MPDRGTLLRVVALAVGVIIAGQLLQHFIGYLVLGLVVWAIISRLIRRP